MGYCEIRQRVCCVLFARCILNRRSRHVVLRTEEERRQSRQDRILTKRFSDPLTIWDVSSSSVQDRNSLKARLWGSLRFKIPAYDEAKTNLSVPKQLQLSIDEQMRGIYGDPLGSIKYDTRPHFWDKTRVSSKSLRRDERINFGGLLRRSPAGCCAVENIFLQSRLLKRPSKNKKFSKVELERERNQPTIHIIPNALWRTTIN